MSKTEDYGHISFALTLLETRKWKGQTLLIGIHYLPEACPKVQFIESSESDTHRIDTISIFVTQDYEWIQNTVDEIIFNSPEYVRQRISKQVFTQPLTTRVLLTVDVDSIPVSPYISLPIDVVCEWQKTFVKVLGDVCHDIAKQTLMCAPTFYIELTVLSVDDKAEQGLKLDEEQYFRYPLVVQDLNGTRGWILSVLDVCGNLTGHLDHSVKQEFVYKTDKQFRFSIIERKNRVCLIRVQFN